MHLDHKNRIFRSRYALVVLSIGLILGVGVLMNTEESDEQLQARRLKPFMDSTQHILNLGDVVIELPFAHRSFWIPARYMDSAGDVVGLDWPEGKRISVGLELIWPEFEGKNKDNRMFFRNVDYPEKTLFLWINRLANTSPKKRSPLSIDNSFNQSLLNKDRRYEGPISEILPWDANPYSDPEYYRDDPVKMEEWSRYKRLTSWKDMGERYGLQWAGERIHLTADEDKVYYTKISWSETENTIDYDDDIYYSVNEHGYVDRYIQCPPDHKKRAKRFVPYCEQRILFEDIDAEVKLRYYRDSLPHWRKIEAKAKELLRSFLVKPEDAEIIVSNETKTLLKRMDGVKDD